ncbi:MAG: hypothetical protein EHM28_11850 [Spirochaetaceae bacterium]|nr:MAG: hypothetical protein EHM28_11850 [Spirochaetaceae bacterium]
MPLFFNYALIMAIIVHISCQVFKVIYYSVRNGRFSLRYLISPGGMPSTHSAFTATVTFTLGLLKGFDTEYFAIAAVFTSVVVYDSLRLRGAVQTLADIMRKNRGIPEKDKMRIPDMIGHTLPEIVVGIVMAMITSIIGYLCRGYFGL